MFLFIFTRCDALKEKSRCKIYLNTGKFLEAMNKKEHSFSSKKLTTVNISCKISIITAWVSETALLKYIQPCILYEDAGMQCMCVYACFRGVLKEENKWVPIVNKNLVDIYIRNAKYSLEAGSIGRTS